MGKILYCLLLKYLIRDDFQAYENYVTISRIKDDYHILKRNK